MTTLDIPVKVVLPTAFTTAELTAICTAFSIPPDAVVYRDSNLLAMVIEYSKVVTLP